MRRYLAFARASWHVYFHYRAALVVASLTTVIAVLVQVYLWRAVFAASASPRIGGLSEQEVVDYVAAAALIAVLVYSGVDQLIGRDVITGAISLTLSRPVNYLGANLATALAVVVANLLLVVAPVAVLLGGPLGLSLPSPADLGPFLLAVLLAFVVMFQLDAMVGMAATVTTRIWGVRFLKAMILAFFSGQMIPLAVFPEPLAAVAAVLPFKAVVDTPVRLYLHRYDSAAEALALLGGQLVWVLLLGALAGRLWRRCLDRVEVLGG